MKRLTLEKTHYEKISADNKEIGFDYQYLCFISKLLDIKVGQKIIYEEKDDIHIETNDGKLTLIQVKHSVQTNANGKIVNLTQLDLDLWKTLYNWVKIIIDSSAGRGKIPKQLSFVQNTYFVLLTNKNLATNPVLLKIKALKDGNLKLKEFKDYLDDLKKQTNNSAIVDYINALSKLNKQVYEGFINNILTEQAKTNVIERIKHQIREKMIKPSRVDDVFNSIYAKLKVDFFEKVHNGEKQIITYEEYLDIFTSIFENFKTTLLPYRFFKRILPDNIAEQYFIQQLIEIGDISENDIVEMADYTESMLQMKMNLDKWYEDNELTIEDIENFHNETFNIWKNNHKKHHTNSSNEDNINAYACLSELREKLLKIQHTELQTSPSNGEFYYLSNEKRLGWKKYWQEKYKK